MAKKRFVTALSPKGWKGANEMRKIAEAGGDNRAEMCEFLFNDIQVQQIYADVLSDRNAEALAKWRS